MLWRNLPRPPPPPINLTLWAEMDGWDGDQGHQNTHLSQTSGSLTRTTHRFGVIKRMLDIPCSSGTLAEICLQSDSLDTWHPACSVFERPNLQSGDCWLSGLESGDWWIMQRSHRAASQHKPGRGGGQQIKQSPGTEETGISCDWANQNLIVKPRSDVSLSISLVSVLLCCQCWSPHQFERCHDTAPTLQSLTHLDLSPLAIAIHYNEPDTTWPAQASGEIINGDSRDQNSQPATIHRTVVNITYTSKTYEVFFVRYV